MFSAEDKKDSGVSSLDDRGLQALLDEAIAYKNPKDREQSSPLFKELLAKAEADERENSGGQRGIASIGVSARYRRGPVRKGDVSERNSRGGSLQNLVHAINLDDSHSSTGRKRAGRRNPQPQVSVSARQREGGSLPCNVNADFCGAAALLRSHDDVASSASLKKRDQHTPIDDVVTGNSYTYKLSGSSRTADDLTGFRVSQSSKRATDSLDDIETVVSRGSGGKRRELKKLGHSSDAIFPESSGGDICSMEDLSKEAEFQNNHTRFENFNSFSSDLASYCLNRHNNVDRSSSDHSVIETDNPSQLDGLALLRKTMNGYRSGQDNRWTKSDSLKDENMVGTEMTAIDRSTDISKYDDHEVDRPIISENFLKSAPRSNGEHIVHVTQSSLGTFLHNADFASGDSMRKMLDEKCSKAGARPLWDGDIRVVRVDPSYSALPSKDAEKKRLDENGNALQGSGTERTDRTERKFKTRKNKTDNNNYVLSEKIPGHRGDTQDINELVLFIESPSNCQDVKSTVAGKNNRNANVPVNIKESKQRNSSSNGKRSDASSVKVKADKRKSNEKQKLKKSNSLDEIYSMDYSDLSSSDNSLGKGGSEQPPKKEVTSDEGAPCRESRQKKTRPPGSVGVDRRSGSGNGSTIRKKRESLSSHRATPPPSEPLELKFSALVHGNDMVLGDPAEFHVVTKKQRKKKSGRSSSIGRNERSQHNAQSNNYHRESHSRRSATVDDADSSILYQYRSAPYRSESPDHSQHQRRKSTSSMPPSDKSADSSDLDSVHSLPISSSTQRSQLDKTSTSSGSTPPASYADIASRMASGLSPPQNQGCPLASGSHPLDASTQNLPGAKWPSVGQAKPPSSSAPLWTANVTLHTATSLPTSHVEEGDQCSNAPVSTVSSCINNSSTKRDAMTNTTSPQESETTDCSSVGNLLSDLSYPPLCESGKSQSVTQCVQTFISQASRTSPAISPGVTMANCVDVEDSAKRAASPAAFDSVRENTRSSTLDRPAVIILDETETETPVNGDPELTFGFEINETLLSSTCTVSSDEAEIKCDPAPPMPVKAQPLINSVANINLDKIVAFIGRAWEDVIKELPQGGGGARGRVQFYSGQ